MKVSFDHPSLISRQLFFFFFVSYEVNNRLLVKALKFTQHFIYDSGI